MRMPWWMPFGSVPEIDAHELQARLRGRAPPQVLDVRTDAEWRAGHIGGALHAPVTELKSRLPSLGLDRNRPVVAVCRSAHRSIPAVRVLRSLGFDAVQLRQGMQAWWREGLPLEGSEGPASGS